MPSDKEQKKSPEEEAEEKKYSFLQEKIKGETGQQGNAYKTIYPNCDLWSDIGDVCLLRFFCA